jgi:hypothetical protein
METKYELIVGADNRREIYDSLEDAENWAEREGYYLLNPDFSHDETIKYFLYRNEEAAEEDKYATYPIGEIRELTEEE